jgi:hypothetical protein
MNKKIITTLGLTTLLTITGCASGTETSNTFIVSSADTTKPVITLKAESVEVELNKEYNAKNNIKSVTDDTDGTLEYAKKATDDSAYYLIDDSKVDTSKAGTYEVKVTAVDKSGNETTSKFSVAVKEKSDDKSETANTDTKSDSSNKKTDSSSSKNTDSSKKSDTSSKKASSSNSSTSSSKSVTTNSNATSNSNNSTNASSSSKQTCQTVHHNATGHYETQQTLKTAAWDESVYDGAQTKCNYCGQTFAISSDYDAHKNYYRSLWNEQYNQTMDVEQTDKTLLQHGSSTCVPVYHTVHHDAEYTTTQVWVEDTAAYDETVCS